MIRNNTPIGNNSENSGPNNKKQADKLKGSLGNHEVTETVATTGTNLADSDSKRPPIEMPSLYEREASDIDLGYETSDEMDFDQDTSSLSSDYNTDDETPSQQSKILDKEDNSTLPPPPPPLPIGGFGPPPPPPPVLNKTNGEPKQTTGTDLRGELLKQLNQRRNLNKTDGIAQAEARNAENIKNLRGDAANISHIPDDVFAEMQNMGLATRTAENYQEYVEKKYSLFTLDIIDEKIENNFAKIKELIPEFIENITHKYQELTLGRTPPWELVKRESETQGIKLSDTDLFNKMKPYKNGKNALYEHAAYVEAMELTLSNFKKRLAKKYNHDVPAIAKYLYDTYKIETKSFDHFDKQEQVFKENFDSMLVGARVRHNLQPEYLGPKDKNRSLLEMIASDDKEGLAKIRHKALCSFIEKALAKAEDNPEILATGKAFMQALQKSTSSDVAMTQQTIHKPKSPPTPDFVALLSNNSDLKEIAAKRPEYASNPDVLKRIDQHIEAIKSYELLDQAKEMRKTHTVEQQVAAVQSITEPAELIQLTQAYLSLEQRRSRLLEAMINKLKELGQPPVTGSEETLKMVLAAEKQLSKGTTVYPPKTPGETKA